jgi:CheY-like chemotaxis protein
MPADVERGLAAGFADYLTKPLDLGRLHAVLAQHLGETPDA